MRLPLVLFVLVQLAVIRASSNNEDILFDFFAPNVDSENVEVLANGQNSSSPDQFETSSGSAAINGLNGSNSALSNWTSDPQAIKTNFKLKKQKLFFGKKLLLWKRNTNRGYGAFLMLCGKWPVCVTSNQRMHCMLFNRISVFRSYISEPPLSRAGHNLRNTADQAGHRELHEQRRLGAGQPALQFVLEPESNPMHRSGCGPAPARLSSFAERKQRPDKRTVEGVCAPSGKPRTRFKRFRTGLLTLII